MFTDFYTSFYYSSLMLCGLISIILFNRLERPFNWLAVLIIATLASELIAKKMAVVYNNNNPVYHVFTPVEYCLYSFIYNGFFNSKKWKRFLLISASAVALFEIINAFLFQPLLVDNTNVMILESLLLMFLSLMLFIRMRTMFIAENILREGMFWFNSMVLVYYAFDILIWGFHSLKVYQSTNPPIFIYNLNFLLSGLVYLIYTFSLMLSINNKNNAAEYK